jgi:alpha-beta hydrolase superfamily lysophospholipase
MIAAASLPVILAACSPVVVPAGEKAMAPHLTGDRYVAADGTALPLAVWPAAGDQEPTAVILGLHGFGDYRNAFEEPARIWSAAGITTYAYDQRGFGKSPTRGRWPGIQTLVDDAVAVAILVRARHPGVPFYVVGESMGGALALVAADRGMEADGLVLSAAAVRSRESLGPVASWGLWFFAHTIPWMPAGPTSIDFKPTDNPRTIEKLQKDPLMLRQPRFDMGYGLVDLMDAARDAAERVHVPYMMLHGMGDRLVPTASVKTAIEVMPPRRDSKLAFYRNGYHLLMRDKDGPAVSVDIASWISNHQAALPSGADADHSQPELAALWGTRRPQPSIGENAR